MKSRKQVYTWFVVLVIAFPVIAFQIVRSLESNKKDLPYYGPDYVPTERNQARRINPFVFTNQDGEQLDGKFTEGKVWVACYFFTACPTICPKMISGMGDVQKEFSNEEDLRLLSFTVDPGNDIPEVLKQYAETRGINTRHWNLLTGDKKELYKYARKELTLMATDGDGGPADFIHSDRLVLIDRDNYIRGYYDGTEPSEVKQLIKDIRKIIK